MGNESVASLILGDCNHPSFTISTRVPVVLVNDTAVIKLSFSKREEFLDSHLYCQTRNTHVFRTSEK